MVESWLLFIVSGLMGGIAHGLIWARGWQDLRASSGPWPWEHELEIAIDRSGRGVARWRRKQS